MVRFDPMQPVFDGAEAIANALHSQAGCEMALLDALDPLLQGRPREAQIVMALVDSIANFRAMAEKEVHKVLTASFQSV